MNKKREDGKKEIKKEKMKERKKKREDGKKEIKKRK